jgi:hypothetical protein
MPILLLALVILLVFCYFWIEKFVELMLLEDRHFPGRFDKIVWAAVFILIAPLAPFAFRLWKSARTAELAPSLTATPR